MVIVGRFCGVLVNSKGNYFGGRIVMSTHGVDSVPGGSSPLYASIYPCCALVEVRLLYQTGLTTLALSSATPSKDHNKPPNTMFTLTDAGPYTRSMPIT